MDTDDFKLALRLPAPSGADAKVIIDAFEEDDQHPLIWALRAIAGGQSWELVEMEFGTKVFDDLSRGYCRKLGVV